MMSHDYICYECQQTPGGDWGKHGSVVVYHDSRPHRGVPFRCPVCGGKGSVPAGFYGLSNTTNDEICRTCGGTGVIWG